MALRRPLYPQSPLGLRVAGEDASLDGIDREMLVAYYQRYYRPNNMALVVVGDVLGDSARTVAERYLAGFASAPVPAMLLAPPPVGQGIKLVLRGANLADRSVIRCGARTVGAAHPDSAALEVMA